MNILALDYGEKFIGTALSIGGVAMPLETIKKKDKFTIKPAIKRIKDLIKEYEINLIILGLPLNMDDTPSKSTAYVLEFKERLARNFKKIEIILWEERLTTFCAEEILEERQIFGQNQKKFVDQMSALLILQNYSGQNQ